MSELTEFIQFVLDELNEIHPQARLELIKRLECEIVCFNELGLPPRPFDEILQEVFDMYGLHGDEIDEQPNQNMYIEVLGMKLYMN